MAPGGSGSRIVRTWVSHGAATGEGTRYETEDGRVWRETFGPRPTGEATGREWGRIVGDRIEPERKGRR